MSYLSESPDYHQQQRLAAEAEVDRLSAELTRLRTALAEAEALNTRQERWLDRYRADHDAHATALAAAERAGAEKAYRDVASRPYDVPRWEVSGDLLPCDEVLRALWDAWVAGRLAALFPPPGAEVGRG